MSWLYPVSSAVAIILLATSEVVTEPFLTWHPWMDTLTSLSIAHLLTQGILVSCNWILRPKLKPSLRTLHYTLACAINIICLVYRQLPVLVLVGIVVHLPYLFAVLNTVMTRTMCPGLWLTNWILWTGSHVIFCFLLPGWVLIQAMVEHKFMEELSLVPIAALFCALAYFGCLFLWELRLPIRAIYTEFQGSLQNTPRPQFSNSIVICVSESSPLLRSDTNTPSDIYPSVISCACCTSSRHLNHP